MDAIFYPNGLDPLKIKFDTIAQGDLSRRVAHLEALYQAESAAHAETRRRLEMLLVLAGRWETERRNG